MQTRDILRTKNRENQTKPTQTNMTQSNWSYRRQIHMENGFFLQLCVSGNSGNWGFSSEELIGGRHTGGEGAKGAEPWIQGRRVSGSRSG